MRLTGQPAGGGHIAAIATRVGFDAGGVTSGRSVAIHWGMLEKVTLLEMRQTQRARPPPLVLHLSGGGRNVLIMRTAAGWDALLERLASLPGAQRAVSDLALRLVKPGSNISITLWEKNPRLGKPELAVSNGPAPELISHLSRTRIRWLPSQEAFVLARFDREPGNITDSLTAPRASLQGCRVWWRGSVMMEEWRDPEARPPPLRAPPS